LPDDRLDLSVVFAPFLDKWLDGSIEVVGHFTAVEDSVSLPVYAPQEMAGLPEGADIVDCSKERWYEIRLGEGGSASLTEDVQGVRGGWVAQDERTESWLQGHYAIGEKRRR
jgi:hypothetical protein